LLSYQANKPVLDQLLKEAGFTGENAIASLMGDLQPPAKPKAVTAPPAAPKPAESVVKGPQPDNG